MLFLKECAFCGEETKGQFAFEGENVTEQPILVGLCANHWKRFNDTLRKGGWLPFHLEETEGVALINFIPERAWDYPPQGENIMPKDEQFPTPEAAKEAATIFALSSKVYTEHSVAMLVLDAYAEGKLQSVVTWNEDDDIPEGVDDWPVDPTIEGNLIMSDSEYEEFVEWLNGPGKTERLLALFEMFRDYKSGS